MDSKTRRLEFRYACAVMIYGTIGLILRYINVPSEIVVLCRGVIGTLFILLYLKLRGRRPDGAAMRANLRWLVISGICLGLNWIFLFAAYVHTTVAVASLCNYMAPAIGVLIAPVAFKEKFSPKKLLCVAVSVAGIVLVSGVSNAAGADVNPTGILFGLLGAGGFVGLIICNKKLKNINSYDRSIVQLGVSAATVLPYVLIMNAGRDICPDTRSVILIIMLGVVHTGFAYILYFGGLGVLPTNVMAVLGYLEPVVSVICSALILGEPLGAGGWIGAGMIVGSAIASERMS